MDEKLKFKSHTEKEFWERTFCACVNDWSYKDATTIADSAVVTRRLRMTGLIKPGVKPAS